MRRDELGGKTGRALLLAASAVMSTFAWALLGGMAQAQCPGDYCIPTPTPTPTGTPFENPQPAAPSQPASGPALMRPFPRIRTAGSFTATRTTFTRVTVKAPRGARIEARCSDGRCKRTRRTAGAKTLRLKRMQRTFPAGVRLMIRVSSPTEIGKHVTIRTRRGKRPLRRDRCLAPGSAGPARCPSG